MANIYNMSDTWNDGATTFTSIKMNVTDTASASVSRLIDLQVGGSTKFSVRKDGSTSVSNSFSAVDTGAGAGVSMSSGTGITGVSLISTYSYGWSPSTTQSFSTPDTRLYRDAAGAIAQRNSTNAQTFNIYNTYTDGSNYERGFMKWNANNLEIGTEAAGTGTARAVRVKSAGTVVVENHLSPSVNTWSLGASVPWNNLFLNNNVQMGGYQEITEMTAPAAPAANKVRIYAEDDGTGKTRLMAVFPTGAAQQIAIEP